MPLTTEAAARKDKLNATGTTLQHRHFAVIASILSELGHDHGVSLSAHRDICEHFAHRLADTNPKFDRARFLAACEAIGA